MHPSEKWDNLADVMRAIEPDLENRIAKCKANPPDPVRQPVTSAIVAAYVSRVELELATIRDGAKALQDQSQNRPTLTHEIQEIESWILRRKYNGARPRLRVKDEQVVGDWFVRKMGYSFSETNRRLDAMRKFLSGKGAPTKHLATLKMMDALICNNWSYRSLVQHMCDCGLSTHNDYCRERIRKRIKGLEAFLRRYNIDFPRTQK